MSCVGYPIGAKCDNAPVWPKDNPRDLPRSLWCDDHENLRRQAITEQLADLNVVMDRKVKFAQEGGLNGDSR